MNRVPTALLYSGGLDSLCAAVLNPGMTLVRVSTGSVYDLTEIGQARSSAHAIGRDLLTVNGVLDLQRYEQDDALMPARNALIALVAAQHAETLHLVSVAGDGAHATDKDADFAGRMTALLCKLFGAGALELPYRHTSKMQLLALACKAQPVVMQGALRFVYSCYYGERRHCGTCKACVRLWGALAWLDLLEYGPEFAKPPTELPYADIAHIYEGRGTEAALALSAYRRHQRR